MTNRRVRVAHVATVDLTVRFLLRPQLRRLREEGFDVTAIAAPGPWHRELAGDGIGFRPWLHATRSWDLGADARAFSELLRTFRAERFDLVHTHTPKAGVLGRLAARVAGVPCVVNTVHGLYATPDDGAVKKIPVLAVERAAAALSDLELYQSEEDLAWARRIRVVGTRKSRLLGNGVDLRDFDAAQVSQARRLAVRRELAVPAGALVVATVGRFVAEKGYRELFRAARSVRAARSGVVFVAVGASEPEKAGEFSADELDAAHADVVFAGWREDVRDVLASADIFVLASWREGVPRSAIEAAALGKPLVLTDIRGCREVGRDNIEALLVPRGDADRLARAILRLVDDAALRARLGAAARRRAVERFDEDRVFARLLDEYASLLAAKGVGAPGSPGRAI